MPDDKKPTTMAALARIAYDQQQKGQRLFNRTDLANIPHTQANIDRAVSQIKFLSEQTRRLLEMSTVERGMYLCWLKSIYTEHGQWEAFCQEQFPDLHERSRQRYMAAYLQAIGEKKPKELPAYEPDELEDAELSREIEGLSTEKGKIAPRRALLDHIDKLVKASEKGQEQLRAAQERIENMEAANSKALKGRLIPKNIEDEHARIEHVRIWFQAFLNDWGNALPSDMDGLRLHKALHMELSERLSEVWEEPGTAHQRVMDAAINARGKRRRGEEEA